MNDNNADAVDVTADSIHEKMIAERLRYTDRLVDEIIDFTAPDVALSETDVKDLAIATLHSIVVLGNNQIAINGVKTELTDIIGDSAKTIDYLQSLLGGISATDDGIADELLESTAVGGL